MARWEKWENSEVSQSKRWEGSEVAIWERCVQEGSKIARQERWESSEVARWKIPCFIQVWGTQGETKISSFYFWCWSTKWKSMMCSRYFCVAAGMEKFSLDLTQAVRNVAGCGNVWNSWSQTDLRWKLCILRWKLVTCSSAVYLVIAEFSTCVLWPLTIGLTVILLVIMV